MKRCTKCGEVKALTEFSVRSRAKDGRQFNCKACDKQYHDATRERIVARMRVYNTRIRDKRIAYCRAYYAKNRSSLLAYFRTRYITHRKQLIKKGVAYTKKRRRESVQVRIRDALRNRVFCTIHRGHKSAPTLALIGCSFDHFVAHIEGQFAPGMTWDNYGRKNGIQCWEIDHKRPCSSFDLTDPQQQRECFNFRNCQPLWAKDNATKGSALTCP